MCNKVLTLFMMTFEAMQVTLMTQINDVFADKIQMSAVWLHGITTSHTLNHSLNHSWLHGITTSQTLNHSRQWHTNVLTNTNTNTQDNVYHAVIMTNLLLEFTRFNNDISRHIHFTVCCSDVTSQMQELTTRFPFNPRQTPETTRKHNTETRSVIGHHFWFRFH